MIMANTKKTTTESFEIVSFAFNPDVTFDVQAASTEALNEIVQELKGFKSRAFYYSEQSQRWVDFIVWETIEDAQSASQQIMANPKALEIFALMDKESLSFSHYDKVGEVANW